MLGTELSLLSGKESFPSFSKITARSLLCHWLGPGLPALVTCLVPTVCLVPTLITGDGRLCAAQSPKEIPSGAQTCACQGLKRLPQFSYTTLETLMDT